MKNSHIVLSVALAVFNEEKNIEECLKSIVDFADEIVVVDGDSTDNTVSIVKKYTNNIIITDNPPIFHINKQKAVNACKGDWILQLDADEKVSKRLKKEIKKIIHDKDALDGYYIPRNNYIFGKVMRKAGLYPDYVIRLFKRGKGKFPCKSVHEQIKIQGRVGYLKNALDHYPYEKISDYFTKADAYTTLTALSLKEQNVSINPISLLTYIVFKPLYTFFIRYIRHKGFQEGWRGLFMSFFSGAHFVWAYIKYIKMKK